MCVAEKADLGDGGGHGKHKRAAAAASSAECGPGPSRWEGEELPRRAVSPGLHMGLTVTINAEVDEFYCGGFQSSGLKGLMHVPVSQPEMVEYGFAISPGRW